MPLSWDVKQHHHGRTKKVAEHGHFLPFFLTKKQRQNKNKRMLYLRELHCHFKVSDSVIHAWLEQKKQNKRHAIGAFCMVEMPTP